MQTRVRTFSGSVVLLSGVPAWAQGGSQTGTASSAASAPDGSNIVHIPDPAWFVAGLATGLVVGVIGAKVFGGSQASDS
jgi:hypothetical protein